MRSCLQLFQNKYDFYCEHKIGYNISNLEDCIGYIYIHRCNVDNVKDEIMKIIASPEAACWFEHYNGDRTRWLKVKKLLADGNIGGVYRLYENHFVKLRCKVMAKHILQKCSHF